MTAANKKVLYEMYHRSFTSAVQKAFVKESSDPTALDRAILFGVRLVNLQEKTNLVGEILNRFQFAEAIMVLIMFVTPRRFTEIFPIDKRYDGNRWGTKDYFSTVEMINKHGWDEPIVEAFDFLWDYQNQDTREFLVNYLSLISDLRRAQGEPGILEEWAEMNNIPLYRMHTDSEGKQFIIDQNGRSKPVKKRPRHLKLAHHIGDRP